MRSLKLYHHGFTMGTPPTNPNPPSGLRQSISGWSQSSTRSNVAFLRSVDEKKITGHGYTLTLTLRDCPASASDWHSLRRAYFERLRRMGFTYLHWVTEWQRRGVPHLHIAIYFPVEVDIPVMLSHWVSAAWRYGPAPDGQNGKKIYDIVGWSRYVSKHVARGVTHYQRSHHAMPKGWRKKTGRIWGHCGEWPTDTPVHFRVDAYSFYCIRRWTRNWRIADARSDLSNGTSRLKAARRLLKCSDRSLSNVRGLSEWLPEHYILAILHFLHSHGMSIEC